MKTKDIANLTTSLGQAISKNSPVLLTGLAVGGVLTTVIFAVRATPKALSVIDGKVWERYEAEVEDPDDLSFAEWLGCQFSDDGYDWKTKIGTLSKKELIQLTWKFYIPAACMGAMTIGCVIGANSINQRRNAALASVYGLTEAAFREYKDKVIETIGKSKELQVRDDISSDKLKKDPLSEKEVIFTGKGEVLCYDSHSGRYFKSDMEKIRQATNDLNRTLMKDMFLTLNDLYYVLGLPNIDLGDCLGFHIDDGLIDISFSAQLTDGGDPCLVLNYELSPRFIK